VTLKPETSETKKRKDKTVLESRTFKDGAIYLFKRADYKKPTWFCRVKVPNAKGYVSQSTKTTDEHEAYKFASDLFNKALISVANGQDINSKKVTIALGEFIKYIENNEKATPSRYIKLLYYRKWMNFFGSSRLKDINTNRIIEMNEWTRSESKSGKLSPNTIKRLTSYQKQFFNWCIEKSYLDNLPRYPKLKTEANRRPHFDNKDYNKLIRHLREFIKHKLKWVVRDRIMLVNYVLILANTGIRVGEARNLKWKDIREIPNTREENKSADIALFVSGKTGAREVVARTSDVREYFKRILELRTKELEKKPDVNDYVFCNKDGSPIGSFKKSFSTLLKSAGVEYDSEGNRRTIYSLRHTYATFRLQEGVHQFVLAKNMGTSVAMLEKHYGHTSNVASAAELTKGGNFKGDKKTKTVDWLMES
jgi:integrase